MSTANLHILIGWSTIFLGVVTGSIIGLFFHKEAWAGGYGSFPRRMMRLGHISFFGLGFINLAFGFTLQFITVPPLYLHIASYGFILGAITMPLSCFLTARWKSFRHLFPIPVVSVLAGIVSILLGWPAS